MRKVKINIVIACLVLLFMSVFSPFISDVDNFCLSDGGTNNQGQCTLHENMPAEGGEGTVDVKWCDPVVAGAPGNTLDCSGNSMAPQLAQ